MIMFDADEFRQEFPALNQSVVYLDSAATALKPQTMIDATLNYYTKNTTTALRSTHSQALENTEQIEQARELVAKLINAQNAEQIIWTRGATESINLVAYSYALPHLTVGSEIIVSGLEHHSNLVPWLHVAKLTGAKVVEWPIEADGSLSPIRLQSLLNNKTVIVAVTQMSNVTGYQPALLAISQLVHQSKAKLVVDGAQGVVHQPLNTMLYDIDFYAFSAHKLYGPTGLGVLYVKKELLENMTIWQGGGKMMDSVDFTDFTPAAIPYKFEAGTPNIASILAFGATLKWLTFLDTVGAEFYLKQLVAYTNERLQTIKNVTLYSVNQSPIITFNIDDIHHSDIATLLDEENIALRHGLLCASPLIKKWGCDGVIRVSLMPYNNQYDIDHFIYALKQAVQILK